MSVNSIGTFWLVLVESFTCFAASVWAADDRARAMVAKSSASNFLIMLQNFFL